MPLRPADAGACRPAPVFDHFPPATSRILALDAQSCRWPLGETTDPAFAFCSAVRTLRSPYCVLHRSMACEPRR